MFCLISDFFLVSTLIVCVGGFVANKGESRVCGDYDREVMGARLGEQMVISGYDGRELAW